MRWFLILLSVYSGLAPAATVLFRGPKAPEVEYRAELESGDWLSPVAAIRKHRPDSEARDHLLSRFAEAQKAFLEASLDVARRELKGVVALITDEDWGQSEREVLLTSLLRLAQLEDDPAGRDQFLDQALNLLPGQNIDHSLFPPPLLARLQVRRQEARAVRPHAIFARGDWQMILINGIACESESCPEFRATKYPARLTYLSDRFVSQTKINEIDLLETDYPARVPWFSGDCAQPIWSKQAQRLTPQKAFCAPLPPNLNVASTPRPSKAPEPNLMPTSVSAGEPVIRTEHRPFYRRTWFWLGVGGAIVAAAVIAAQPRGHDEIEPTRNY